MRRDRPETPVLVFVHIPKTAGTTFRSIIWDQYEADRVAQLIPLEEAAGDMLPVKDFPALPYERRASLQAVMGHVGFGLHEVIPRPTAYTTILRDPVTRFISGFRYWNRNPEGPLKEMFRVGMSVEDTLEKSWDNVQTRMLGQSQPWTRSPGDGLGPPCPREQLEVAKHNLEIHFPVFGLQQRFGEFVLLAADEFGWKGPIVYESLNVAPGSSPDLLTEARRSAIEERDHLDVELWDFAQDLYLRRVERKGRLFPVRVRLNSSPPVTRGRLRLASSRARVKRSLSPRRVSRVARRIMSSGRS